MPVFEYSALTAGGKKARGIIDAESILAARQKLRESGIYPVDLKESSAGVKADAPLAIGFGAFMKKVGLRELAVMTRQLATLLDAGLPLVQSLNVIINQTVNPQFKKTLAQVKEDVNEGNSLAESIAHYPAVFSPFYVNMVRAGEASGTLNVVLERLADFNESQQLMRGKIRAALTYPAFMFLVGSAVLFFMTTFIVPKITSIFEEMHQSLPGITIVLIAVSNFFRFYWFIIVIVIVLLVMGLRHYFTRTVKGQYHWDRLAITAPLIGGLIHRMAMARFSRTLGTLLQSGVPLLTALAIVKNVVDNRLIADVISKAGGDVEEGQSLSGTLGQSSLIPPLMIQMIAVGEQSGNLEAMLYKVADSYETEVESNITVLTSMLEPVMILVMGFFVAFIVLSILLPIFEMNQLVR